MGVVYQALDPTIGRTIAIKSIRLQDLTDTAERERLRERLVREAQSAGILSHPGIVTIYDIAEENGMAYIFMEFVNGPPLEKLLLDYLPLPALEEAPGRRVWMATIGKPFADRVQTLLSAAGLQAEAIGLSSLGAAELIARMRRTWLGAFEKHLRAGGVTVAVVNIDMLLEHGGLLDELRAKGYVVDPP